MEKHVTLVVDPPRRASCIGALTDREAQSHSNTSCATPSPPDISVDLGLARVHSTIARTIANPRPHAHVCTSVCFQSIALEVVCCEYKLKHCLKIRIHDQIVSLRTSTGSLVLRSLSMRMRAVHTRMRVRTQVMTPAQACMRYRYHSTSSHIAVSFHHFDCHSYNQNWSVT